MHRSFLLATSLCALASAQTFLLAGTTYSASDGSCPISVTASDSVDMLIYPVDGSDSDATKSTVAAINKYLNSQVSDYNSQLNGVLFWYATITDVQACYIAGITGVSSSD